MIGVCFALIFPTLYIFAIHPADHIPTFFKAVFALCALTSGAFALNDALKVWRIFTTPGDWRATIRSGRLMWEVAIPCRGLPLDMAMDSISKAVLLEISRTGKDSDGAFTESRERFELHMTDGAVLTFDRDTAGVHPHRVFLALAQHGIRYELWSQDRTKDSVDRSRVFQRSY